MKPYKQCINDKGETCGSCDNCGHNGNPLNRWDSNIYSSSRIDTQYHIFKLCDVCYLKCVSGKEKETIKEFPLTTNVK